MTHELAIRIADHADRRRLGFDPTAIERDTDRNEWQLAHMFSNGTIRILKMPSLDLRTGRGVTIQEAESLFLRQIEQEEWRIHTNNRNQNT